MERYLQIINVALEAVLANKFRTMLTALGIIFGVAAVIAMMAIVSGTRQEILNQIKLLGVNNIVIQPILESDGGNGEDDDEEGQTLKKKYSPGLTLEDAESIMEVIPTVERVSPQVTYQTSIVKDGKRTAASLQGVTNKFFEVYNLELQKGEFFDKTHLISGKPVCIISPVAAAKLFPHEDPIGKTLKCGQIWLKVIGILEDRGFSTEESEGYGISNYDKNIYAPLKTVLLRFKDRSLITQQSLLGGGSEVVFYGGGVVSFSSTGGSEAEDNMNQLDKIVVQVINSEQLSTTSEAIEKMLKRRHQEVKDYEVKVPEILLRQEQQSKDLLNIVLGAIASISLIVGGIGIMNIMLASVMERIREIGVRMATGARKKDIIFQFLSEATLISISGGFLGILLGILLSKIIMKAFNIMTIISPWSIIISFGVAAFIGILFGYMPAKRAANQDPVESLRHD
ncbi:MAG: ABC transporter permease [Bacteroidales bacterium]|nr:ABC transporter permease [Bacteroidales bacterium]MCF8343690.1 ABC transporter permease [Bacteroidales bacterium]MCF8374751.1 ABC transporter permease [Bacteroidales bacterium]MCF8399845.1 ABC transporter permease [Bacteroidales bacterium]